MNSLGSVPISTKQWSDYLNDYNFIIFLFNFTLMKLDSRLFNKSKVKETIVFR